MVTKHTEHTRSRKKATFKRSPETIVNLNCIDYYQLLEEILIQYIALIVLGSTYPTEHTNPEIWKTLLQEIIKL